MTRLIPLVVIVCTSLISGTASAGCRAPTTCIATNVCTRQHEQATSQRLNTSLIFPCDMANKKKGVCCPPTTSNRIGTEEKKKLLPTEECGLATTDKIINGKIASLGQFPWMALIGTRFRGNSTVQYGCGGSIINNRYVLTAAHCVRGLGLSVVNVRLGEHDRTTPVDCVVVGANGEKDCADPVLDVPVEQVIPHRGYSTATLKNDIALLRIRPPLREFTAYVSPICLPFGVNDTGAEENNYLVSGWGRQSSSQFDAGTPELRFAHVVGISRAECSSFDTKVEIKEGQLCADSPTLEDACKGDSGGPLMRLLKLPQRATAQAFLLGLVSFGLKNCDEQNAPTAYTRVNHYLDWILDNIAP